jgi:hypothetical protein
MDIKFLREGKMILFTDFENKIRKKSLAMVQILLLDIL